MLSLFFIQIILHSLVVKVFILRSKPFSLKVKLFLLSLIGCLCCFMSFNGFFELFLSSLLIYFKFPDTCLHLSHLSFFFSLKKLSLELSTWTFMLNLFNQRLYLLRRQERIRQNNWVKRFMRFIELYCWFRTCLLSLIHTFNLNVSKLARTVNGSKSKLLFGHIIRITYFGLDSYFAKTQSLKSSLMNDLPVSKHVFMSHDGWNLTMVVNPSMCITLTLSSESTFLCFHEVILWRKYYTSIRFQISISSYHVRIHSLLLDFKLTIIHWIYFISFHNVFNILFARVDW